MKKLINAPAAVVHEMLEGLVAQSDRLALLEGSNAVLLAGAAGGPAGVALISGGGSGHEPAHAGYVGKGMLTAAVAGDVFTSPSVDAILDTIRAVAGPRGVLLIVKNYTGDRLNFGLAAELAIAEGIATEIVVVADDVSLKDTVPAQRRRGIAGAVLVHKIAGALAEAGHDLPAIAEVARRAAGAIGTMGVGLSACTVPAVGKPGFSLADDEIELGLGIHGEKGVERTALQPVDALVDRLVDSIALDLGLGRGDRVVAMVNNLGATPAMELAIVMRRTLARLRDRGVVVERAWQGTFLSALDMAGVSVTLMRVDDRMLELIDAPTEAPAWPRGGRLGDGVETVPRRSGGAADDGDAGAGPLTPLLRARVEAVTRALRARVALFTELDSLAGDGDLGASVERAAEALAELPASAYRSPQALLLAIARTLRRVVGGSSGPFYAIGLSRAARPLAGVDSPTPEHWLAAFDAAVSAVEELGGARVGDRTMVDALRPALEEMRRQVAAGDLDMAAIARSAAEGARQTAGMQARLGRASYLGDRTSGVEDGGAAVVATWLGAL